MAATAFNPSDKDTHITLSNVNLTAASTFGWSGCARTVDSHLNGKYYFECTYGTVPSAGSGIGVFVGTVATTTYIGSAATGTCGLRQDGAVWVDGSGSITVGGSGGTVTFGSITNGTVVCVAIDLTAHLLWFRLGSGGNWNANAARNPATGTGGVGIANLGVTHAAFPAAAFNSSSGADTLTANFGGSAFTGAVPSGFTAGWPTGADVTGGTVQARAMVLA